MSQMTPFENEAIRIALLKMFRPGGWLDICTIDECLKLARCHAPERTYSALRAMHCVSWSAMTPEMRQMTAETILGLFESPPLDLPQLGASFIPAVPEPPQIEKPNVFRRILGKVS